MFSTLLYLLPWYKLILMMSPLYRDILHLKNLDVTTSKTMMVFGANESNHKEQKHLVNLDINIYFMNFKNILSKCSGSVISVDWILTSAHCFRIDQFIIDDIHVQVKRREYERWVTLGEVQGNDIISHPNYVHTPRNPKSESDLALLKTSEPMKLRKDFMPIILNRRVMSNQKKISATTTGTIAGYGVSELHTTTPRQGLVTIYCCSKKLGRNLLCSKSRVRAGPGDSGGSLVLKNGKLVGVTSSSCSDVFVSKNCESVYVDVAVYLDWIKNVTGIE